MNEPHTNKVFAPLLWKRLLSRTLLVAVLLAFILFITFRILLITPLASDYISQALSRYTNQKVTVAGLSAAGQTIYLDGIIVESPPGFKNRKMISVHTIALTPDISALLSGENTLTRLEITGLGVTAEKNDKGIWNFSELLKLLKKKKSKPSVEVFIRHFAIQDASLQVNGHTLEKLGMTLADFSTKGTTNSTLELSGKDSEGNPLRLTAEGHLGNNPAFRLTAKASAVDLAPLQQFLHDKHLHIAKARGRVSLSAELHNRLLTVQTTAAVKDIFLSYPGGSLPIDGHLDFEARYNSLPDSAELIRANLAIDKIITIRASGTMQHLSKESAFTLKLAPDRVDLGALSSLVAESDRQGFYLSGEMTSRGFRLTGNRNKGITGASGELTLREVGLKKAKQLILTGGAADFSLQKAATGWQIEGKVFSGRHHESSLVDAISLPFNARVSPRFRPVHVAAPAFKATLAGIPIRGSFLYRDTATAPFSLNCTARKVSLTSLNRFLAKKSTSLHLISGKLTARANLSGISPEKFHGKVTLDLVSAEAKVASGKISLTKAALISTVQKNSRGFSAYGSLKASGGKIDSKPFGVSTKFSLGNRAASLRAVELSYGTSRIKADRFTAQIPEKDYGQEKDRKLLLATFAGAAFRSTDLAVSGIAGQIKARYGTTKQEKSLSGTSNVSFTSLSFRDHTLASGTLHLSADGKNARAEITGFSLGGTLSARAATEIFSKTREISFSASLMKQHLEQLEKLLPGKLAPRIATGTANAHMQGRYSRRNGIEGTLATSGENISLKGPTGKTLISGITASLDVKLDGQKLSVQKCLLSHPQGPSLRIGGTVQHFTSTERTGKLSFSMPAITLNSLLDAFANALPRNLQEASCEGSGALAGTIDLQDSNTLINGDLTLESASLEIPSQKINVSGIAGIVPFSLEFPGKKMEPERQQLSYSRKNYSRLLEEQSKISGTGKHISIRSLRFGAFETGNISLFVSASAGMMRISPIKVQLYDGRLLGGGYLILNGTPKYGADILLNDVSLKDFCNSFPSIQGYITGRVDGILSLKNEKGGLKELTGFVNLWTRSGKGEEMLVSKEFLQKLAGKKLRGFFFQNDRAYDNGEISAYLQHNYLTFEKLDISHTNFLGMRDLSVSVAPVQNRIALDHLFTSIRDAAARGKGGGQGTAPVQTDLKWLE